jgi:hypothetical protein
MPTLAAIRRTCLDEPSHEGQIRLLFVREGARICLVQTASETAKNADQFLARYLADMITDVAAPSVVVTISRDNGRPTHSDRQLWQLLFDLLTPSATTILDLVTVGRTQAWSIRRARPLGPSASHRSPSGRRSASRARAR